MSKWRPSKECIYVVPDIHGQYHQLELILSRILPLRKTDGVRDKIVFLGDYVDRRVDSHRVLDRLIELKEIWGDQVVCLKGNHELMFMNAMAPSPDSKAYMFWMNYGGVDTLQGYIKRSGVKKNHNRFKDPHANFDDDNALEYVRDELENPYSLARQRIKDFVPQEHKDFINACEDYHETDDFIFVHGGCDPLRPMDDNLAPHQIAMGMKPINVFAWDRELFKMLITVVGQSNVTWEKTIVTGHNGNTGYPFIIDKFMMLDCSCASKLLVMEMHSKEAFIAKKKKKRLVKLDYIL